MSLLRRFSGYLVVAEVGLLGCPTQGLDPSDAAGVSLDAASMDSGGFDAGRGPYPAGPFGAQEGDTLPSMRFDGYARTRPGERAEDAPFEIGFELGALRHGPGRYLLLNVASEWCVGCRIEAEVFNLRYPGWRAKQGELMSVLIEDRNRNPALPFHLDRWILQQNVEYPIVHDPEGFVDRVVRPSALPFNLIIDLETMVVLEAHEGEDLDFVERFEALLAD